MTVLRLHVITMVLLTACGAPSTESDVMDPLAVIEVATRWVGTLPCADCAGVRYELSLNPVSGRFTLLTTYLATSDGDRTYERIGRYAWNETVVCVTPSLPEPEECFLLADANTLQKLDMAGNVIESELNYDLTRVD
jgi:copper homeostasis protein (lipoprotein)